MKIQARGHPHHDVLRSILEMGAADAKWRDGRTWSLVFFAGQDGVDVIQEAYAMYMSENGLSPVAFPSLRRFEAELVSMATSMLGGGSRQPGR